MQKRIALTTLFTILFTGASFAQGGNRPSPAASATCDLGGGKTVKTNYSSPRMKGRKIYGELVPFGEVWRTGANEATTFVASADVVAGGTSVPAGSYTIFTVPKADAWSLVISKKTGEWGTDYPGEKEDLVRVPMTISKTSAPIENFTIALDQAGSKCTLRIEWENTRASVEITK